MLDQNSTLKSPQSPAVIVMVRPHNFTPNPETALDNHFQSPADAQHAAKIAAQAYKEVTQLADALKAQGVRVHMFEDKGTQTPDSVFPNNWVSTHADGRICLYPMYPKNRRLERRMDIISALRDTYNFQEVVDLSAWENTDKFLEGTGSMVLDYPNKTAYAALSNRTDAAGFAAWCETFGFTPISFEARDISGQIIYHTNVMMCLGTAFAMIGLDTITPTTRANAVKQKLEDSGRQIINLSQEQIGQFAGNAFELEGGDGRILAMSRTAYDSLAPHQIATIAESATPLPIAIPTIEMAGGSVRCMLAGVYLPLGG